MTDVVSAEVRAVQDLHRGVTRYAESLRTSASSIRREALSVERQTREVVDQRRVRLRQAEADVQTAQDALRRCTEDGRRACEQALREAQGRAAQTRQRFEHACQAERQAIVVLHELMQVVLSVEGAIADQSSAASSALIELQAKLRSITAGRLTGADRDALRDITGSGHQQLNRSLSQGSIEEIESMAARVNAVSRALEKLPVHSGTVLRGSAGNLTEAQIAEYEPGAVRVEDRFVHSSVDADVADGRFHGNVVWAIESSKGRAVEAHSEVPSEKEVMFDKFSRFEVLAKDRVEGTDQWLIYMREL